MEILLIIVDFWSTNITEGLDIVCFGFDHKIMQKFSPKKKLCKSRMILRITKLKEMDCLTLFPL